MIEAEPIARYAASHPEQTAALVAGVAGTAANYEKTGKLPLGRVPFRALRRSWRDLADRWFGRPRPRGVPGLLVDVAPEELERELRAANFESADNVSFEYDREALNMRRPNGTRPHPRTGAEVPMELHPRTFALADGRQLVLAHDEASRYEATGGHLDGLLLSWDRGQSQLGQVLDERGVQNERIESERAAGVEVVPPES